MAELRSLLSFMDADDRVRVLRYFDGLFDDAGMEGEEALIEKLGSPVRQVLRIEKQYRDILDREEAEAYSPSAPVVPEPELFPAADEQEKPLPDDEPEEPDEEENLLFALPTEPQEPAAPDKPYAGVITAETFALDEVPKKPEDDNDNAIAIDNDDNDDNDNDDDDDERFDGRSDSAESVSGGRVAGAVFVTIPMTAFVMLGIALSLAVALLALVPGAVLGAAGGYLWGYVVGGIMSYLPDLLLMGGVMLMCFALSLLLLWLGIWLAVSGARLTVRITASVYRAILRGGDREHE